MVRNSALILSLVVVLFAATGCSRKSSCVEGEVTTCACPSGAAGTQTCAADGTFGACDCMTGDAGNDSGLAGNECGGIEELRWSGEAALPGDACGPCGDGVLACNGPDALECRFETELNECGGCGTLPASAGEACGACDDGVWTCQGDGTLACEGATPENECGGCATLQDTPNFACANGTGVFHCQTVDSVVCVTDGNACGGTEVLQGPPTGRCGVCGGGKWACDSPDAVICENEEAGQNDCGGCGLLPEAPGTPCDCGGTWECAGPNSVNCEAINLCSGCGSLGNPPGTSCGAQQQWACDPGGGVACVSGDRNPCGGADPLGATPGDACGGTCGNGTVVCVAPNRTACVGESTPNACGGCGGLPGVPGNVCGFGRVWQCEGEELVCSADQTMNACGGSGELPAEPLTPCGDDCGTWGCADVGELACLGEKDRMTDPGACGTCDNQCEADQACIDGDCEMDRAVQIEAGDIHTCARMASGRVYCWGSDVDGQLGDSETHLSGSDPVLVEGLDGVVDLSVGFRHSCALRGNGAVLCWGRNVERQIDDGDSEHSVPARLGLPEGALDVAAGRGHTCVLFDDGVRCRGDNSSGELGDGTTDPAGGFVEVVDLGDIRAIEAGNRFTCAIEAVTDAVFCWGTDQDGRLGNGPRGDSPSPDLVDGLSAESLSLTNATLGNKGRVCAVRSSDGAVVCWGDDGARALGNDDGLLEDQESPQDTGLRNGVAVATNGRHGCAVTDAGVQCWGAVQQGDNFGQLGTGSFAGSERPASVVGSLGDVVDVAAGQFHTCALNAEGEIFCWGTENNGVLADAQVDSYEWNRNVPGRVIGIVPLVESACTNTMDDDGDMAIDCVDVPDCAVELAGTSVEGTIAGHGGYFRACGSTGPDVGYVWTAPSAGMFTFSTTNSTDTPPNIEVRGSDCIALDACATEVTVDAEAGETFSIVLEMLGGSNAYTLEVTQQ